MKLALIVAGVLTALAPHVASQRAGLDPAAIWKTLSARYDKDQDGKLTKAEYARGADKFDRWDRNRDGVISAADFAGGSDRGDTNRRRPRAGAGGGNRAGAGPNPRMMHVAMVRMFARPADADNDRQVTAAEWQAFCDKLDCDKNGVVSKDELPNAATMNERMFDVALRAVDQNRDGELQLSEVAAVFARLDTDKSKVVSGEELMPMRRGGQGNAGAGRRRGGNARGNRPLEAGVPRPGEAAPDFDLPLVDQPTDAKAEVTVQLSSFRGKKPVALIFGSYT